MLCFRFDAGASRSTVAQRSPISNETLKDPINKIHIFSFFSTHYFAGWRNIYALHSHLAFTHHTIPLQLLFFIQLLQSHRKIHLIAHVQKSPHFSSDNILDTQGVCGRPKTKILTIENCAQKKWSTKTTPFISLDTLLSLFRSSRSVMFAYENYSTQHLNTIWPLWTLES